MTNLTKLQIFNLVKTKKEAEAPSNVVDDNYYVEVFSQKQGKGVFDHWNWACFLSCLMGAGFFWFFYRRMYVRGLVAFLITYLVMESPALLVLWSLLIGFYGNFIYFDFLKKKHAMGYKHIGTNGLISGIVLCLFLALLLAKFYGMLLGLAFFKSFYNHI